MIDWLNDLLFGFFTVFAVFQSINGGTRSVKNKVCKTENRKFENKHIFVKLLVFNLFTNY